MAPVEGTKCGKSGMCIQEDLQQSSEEVPASSHIFLGHVYTGHIFKGKGGPVRSPPSRGGGKARVVGNSRSYKSTGSNKALQAGQGARGEESDSVKKYLQYQPSHPTVSLISLVGPAMPAGVSKKLYPVIFLY